MSAPLVDSSAKPDLDGFDRNGELSHGMCESHEWIAWCGADLTGQPFGEGYLEDDDDACVVCLNLEICPRCGRVL